MVTTKVGTDPILEFLSSEQTSGLNNIALGVHPVRLNAIEPGTLARQVAGNDAHADALLPDLSIVGFDPGAHLLAAVPGGVVPDQEQGCLADLGEFFATPGQVLRRDEAHQAVLDKAQPDLWRQRGGGGRTSEQQAIAGQRLGVWISLRRRLFNQPPLRMLVRPGAQGRLCHAAPPHFVLETQCIVRVLCDEGHQSIAGVFFRPYAGSGLVIHCFARFQRTPSRCKAVRTASRLTPTGVKPCAQLTSAANARLPRLVCLPKLRGLWCSNARSCSAAAESKAKASGGGPMSQAARPLVLPG